MSRPKACPHCGLSHPASYHTEKYADSYTVKDKLSDSGYPTHDKDYPTAHEAASKAEKKKFPKGYKKLKKLDESLPKHELAGKNLKSGKLEVSKRVPPNRRSEVAYHERVESKKLRENKK